MLRRFRLEGLQAELSAVSSLLEQSVELGDPIGEYQLSKRRQSIEHAIKQLDAERERSASIALYFGGAPVLGSRGISAEFAGVVLDQFQELVTRDYAIAELGVLGGRGPIPLRRATKLMVTEVARGSFGFVLDELSDQMELEDTSLKQVVDDVVMVLERTASPNDVDFEETAEAIDSRMLLALKNFFVTLDSHGATLRIVEDIVDYTLDEQAVRRGRIRTEATSIDEAEVTVNGLLEGFLPEHRKFELRQNKDVLIYGSVSKEATEQYIALRNQGENPIGKALTCKLQRRVVKPLNRPPREVNRLLEIISEGRAPE